LKGRWGSVLGFTEELFMPAVVDEKKCDGCGTCQDNCPSEAIHVQKKEKDVAVVVPENCIDCDLCKENCPQGAIEMKL
jgi:NAD-dependent dihydropyrimidine dehydrogenase PreA subunit